MPFRRWFFVFVLFTRWPCGVSLLGRCRETCSFGAFASCERQMPPTGSAIPPPSPLSAPRIAPCFAGGTINDGRDRFGSDQHQGGWSSICAAVVVMLPLFTPGSPQTMHLAPTIARRYTGTRSHARNSLPALPSLFSLLGPPRPPAQHIRAHRGKSHTGAVLWWSRLQRAGLTSFRHISF